MSIDNFDLALLIGASLTWLFFAALTLALPIGILVLAGWFVLKVIRIWKPKQ